MNFLSKDLQQQLSQQTFHWLVTGGAGFIGSHLIETLLANGQRVRVLDNFSTGNKKNFVAVESKIGPKLFRNLEIVEGDVRERETCLQASQNIDFVLHHAAFISVPLSIEKPQECYDINTTGTQNLLKSCVQNKVKKFIFASSAAVYGNDPQLPKTEKMAPSPLSPYAISKKNNEDDALQFFKDYGLQTIGFRYFNIFGPRQDPGGAYASVIPRWIQSYKLNQQIQIFGDGMQTRDFCHVSQVVQMNLRAALTQDQSLSGQVFNVGLGAPVQLLDLLSLIKAEVSLVQEQSQNGNKLISDPVFLPSRGGDIRHSHSSIDKAVQFLKFNPTCTLQEGLRETILWYLTNEGSL